MQLLWPLLPLLLVAQASAEDAAGVVASRSIDIGAVTLSVLSASGEKLVGTKGAFPAKLLASPQITSKDSIEVSFTAALTGGPQDSKAQQVFLALQHTASGAAAYALVKPKKDGVYAATVPTSVIGTQIGKQTGAYLVSLLVGDPSASKPVVWALGEVELVLEPREDLGQGRARTALTEVSSNQQPVITHIFRPADKRPPAAVSLAFAVLSVAPLLLVFLWVAGVLGANFKAWPKDGATALAALLFHVLLLVTLGVYLLFWTVWNLAETLPVVLGLGVLLALTGQKALSGIATARFQSQAKKD